MYQVNRSVADLLQGRCNKYISRIDDIHIFPEAVAVTFENRVSCVMLLLSTEISISLMC